MIVTRCSRRKLTVESDKLAALSGVAPYSKYMFRLRWNDCNYAAGLWYTSQLLTSFGRLLLWVSTRPSPSTRHKAYTSPPWSWTCLDGPIDPFYIFDENVLHPTPRAVISEPEIRLSNPQLLLQALIDTIASKETPITTPRTTLQTSRMSWPPSNGEILDIGGSSLGLTFENQLPQTFKGKEDFPKEVAYTSGMENGTQSLTRSTRPRMSSRSSSRPPSRWF